MHFWVDTDTMGIDSTPIGPMHNVPSGAELEEMLHDVIVAGKIEPRAITTARCYSAGSLVKQWSVRFLRCHDANLYQGIRGLAVKVDSL